MLIQNFFKIVVRIHWVPVYQVAQHASLHFGVVVTFFRVFGPKTLVFHWNCIYSFCRDFESRNA